MTRRTRLPSDRDGFILPLVVLMLFAISVAGATGYIVVSNEFTMARYAGQGEEALTVARAGLHRFVSESMGVVGDSASYAIGDGIATVTTRKIAEEDADNHLYYIRSEGRVEDFRTSGAPARRVVGGYAYHRRHPIPPYAALVVAAERSYAENLGGVIDGNDHSTPTDCAGGGVTSIAGTIARVATGALSGGVLDGSPAGQVWAGGFSEVYDSVGVRWDILSDPNFPVEFDGFPPDFGSLPPDSFPVVRVSGYFNPDAVWSGRGLLIVDGELDARSSFTWDGIILAGAVDDIHEGHVRGMLIAGLDGPNSYDDLYWRGTIRYYSCFVDAANESLSQLELIESSVFEAS